MFQRGDIVVERLTGRRAIVIEVPGDDRVVCRYADGRCEDRFNFEIDMPASLLGWLVGLFFAPSRPREAPAAALSGRVRPLIVRQPTAS